MRTIVAGSRAIVDPELVFRGIEESGFEVTTVLSGGADGVDTFGEQWAKQNGVPVERYRPDYKNNPPKVAPLIRNTTMVQNADALIAVWDGKSKGTQDIINKARNYNLKLYIYQVFENEIGREN